MSMKVELKPHVAGYRSTPDGMEPIEHSHWLLWVDGRQVGIVPKPPATHVPLHCSMPPEKVAEIKRELAKLIGERSEVTSPPEIDIDDETDDTELYEDAETEDEDESA